MNDEQKYLFDLNGFILLPGVLTADECKTLREFVLTLRNDPESLPEIDRHSLSGPGSMLLDHPGRDGRGPVPPAVADVGEDSGDLFVGLGEGDHARRIDINSKGVVLVIDGDVVPEATDLNPDQVFRRTHHPFRGSEGWSAVDRHALWAGLEGNQPTTKHRLCRLVSLVRRRDHPNPTCLAATTSVDLGLDYQTASQPLSNRSRLLGRGSESTIRYWHTSAGQDCLGLVLVNLQGLAFLAILPNLTLILIRCPGASASTHRRSPTAWRREWDSNPR